MSVEHLLPYVIVMYVPIHVIVSHARVAMHVTAIHVLVHVNVRLELEAKYAHAMSGVLVM